MADEYKRMEIKALLIHPLTPYYISWQNSDLPYRLMNGDGHYGGDIQRLLMMNIAAAADYDRIAMNNLGCMFYRGIGVQKNERRAIAYLETAVRLGTNVALVNLGTIAEDHEDCEQAFSYYTRAYHNGDALGQWYYAGMLREGRGTDQNDVTAYQCYSELVNKEFAPAYWPIGCMQRDGTGTDPDEEAAVLTFRYGDDKCPYCITDYARYVQKGIYAYEWEDRSEEYAMRCIARGAAMGDPRAYGDLGRAFELGQNVPRNMSNAICCYKCGAALGDQTCIDAVERILPAGSMENAAAYVRSPEICDILRTLGAVGKDEACRDNGLAGCVAHLFYVPHDPSIEWLYRPENDYEDDDNNDEEDSPSLGAMDAANAARRDLEASIHQYRYTPNRDARREVYCSLLRCIRDDGRVLVHAMGTDLLGKDAEILPVVTADAAGRRYISVITSIDEVKKDVTLGYCSLMPLERLLTDFVSNESADEIVVNPLGDAYHITKETAVHLDRLLEDTGYDQTSRQNNDQPYGHSLFQTKKDINSYLPMWALRSACLFLRAHGVEYWIKNSWDFAYYDWHDEREKYLEEVRRYQNVVELYSNVVGAELLAIAEETLFLSEEALAPVAVAVTDMPDKITIAGYYVPYNHYTIIATPNEIFVENNQNCGWQYLRCGGRIGYANQLLDADIKALILHGKKGIFELQPENQETEENSFEVRIDDTFTNVAGAPAVQNRQYAEEYGRDLMISDKSKSAADLIIDASVLTLEQEVEFAVNTGLISRNGPHLVDGKPQPRYTEEELDDAIIDRTESTGALSVSDVVAKAQRLIDILESVQNDPDDLKDYYRWKEFNDAMYDIKHLPCGIDDIYYWLGRVGDPNPHGWHASMSWYEQVKQRAAEEAADSSDESGDDDTE